VRGTRKPDSPALRDAEDQSRCAGISTIRARRICAWRRISAFTSIPIARTLSDRKKRVSYARTIPV